MFGVGDPHVVRKKHPIFRCFFLTPQDDVLKTKTARYEFKIEREAYRFIPSNLGRDAAVRSTVKTIQ